MPEQSTLYGVVLDTIETLHAALDDGYGFAGGSLPSFVRQEFEKYLDCGLLCRGFARLVCENCSEPRLVAFSCKGRGFCPSCLGRRMCQTAANLVEHVLPAVPIRQWVLTVPYEIRPRLAYDGKLLGAVNRLFVDSVLAWYRRRMEAEGVAGGRSGAVVVVQRTSSDLRLNPHLHALFLDGVYTRDAPDGAPVFHALPALSTSDVADVLQVVRVRLIRLLERRGVITPAPDAAVVDDEFALREPVLARLAAAAVTGLPPAGPERRHRTEITLRGRPGAVTTAPLCVAELGFSLHAATRAAAEDDRGRETLVKYVLRPPIAGEHLQPGADGRIRIELKRPFRDGTRAIELDPLALLYRLAAAVPAPRFHTVRYSGVLGSASPWRSEVIPAPKPPPPETSSPSPADPDPAPPLRGGFRSRYRGWAELIERAFATNPRVCPACGGPMRLLALVKDAQSIARFLRHQGMPTEPPRRAPARAPPYGRSPVVRHREPDAPDLFHG